LNSSGAILRGVGIMTERKVSLEQSLIAQEQELLNPPSDGPIPEFALYRALRMAELAILGELERLKSSHKLVGLQLEYEVAEISDTATDEESQLYSVGIGQSSINSDNKINISNLLSEKFRDLLIDRLYEYLQQKNVSFNSIQQSLYLGLFINLTCSQFSRRDLSRDLRRESENSPMRESTPNLRTTESSYLSRYCDRSCGSTSECNDGISHIRTNERCKCRSKC
jgi:hypothetical protein